MGGLYIGSVYPVAELEASIWPSGTEWNIPRRISSVELMELDQWSYESNFIALWH